MSRNQLEGLKKCELIDITINQKEDRSSATITRKLNGVTEELDTLKKLVVSPESVINRKIESLENKLDKQAEIIFKQQLNLES